MHWHLVYTKPRQEEIAKINLDRQGFECYFPLLAKEKLQNGVLAIEEEPLFPRYLFVRPGSDASSRSWAPIRSTRGVSCIVRFGNEPARVDSDLINSLKLQQSRERLQPEPLFAAGDRIVLIDGAFAGVEGIYQMPDGQSRVMVLIELLSRPVRLRIPLASLRKSG